MNILFTICGRAGSKGFKNKNLKEMNGVPLVYYTLASIKAYTDVHSENNVTVAVNTDSYELVECIKKQKTVSNIVFVERKESLAGDTAPKVDVIKDTFLSLSKEKRFDVIIDLDITSPYRRLKDIENIVSEFNKKEYDIVFSVVKARRSPYFNMVEKKNNGYFRKICESNYTARQQAPQSYEMNASIYAYNPNFLSSQISKTILDYNCGIIEMPDFLVLDIDSEDDFEMMQMLHSYYCKLDDQLNNIYETAKRLS
ncbi:acylneuraminate cytidylyltransferase family protein [Ruminococcus sp.]|uniref:acylneuraminate cytidylyltransferase family protein n=1 Tax=Ruminococcus sp. TaxID=41978 RepID=UPI0025E94D05|nr:acylneuraminate cytidylyltransferase family protein [Ruminococcus sp.]MCR4639509.1 acylneuraminate cytidylyltransferase family protein [Ruminococcus sp.]